MGYVGVKSGQFEASFEHNRMCASWRMSAHKRRHAIETFSADPCGMKGHQHTVDLSPVSDAEADEGETRPFLSTDGHCMF